MMGDFFYGENGKPLGNSPFAYQVTQIKLVPSYQLTRGSYQAIIGLIGGVNHGMLMLEYSKFVITI